ncbi:MAG TPA: protein phosphatase 2C domain-containing protein [Aggregatilineaceae bacterium]|nr:protein phosphatase 2C domain-containing protein [Anaerolineae bacterium]HMM28441.1 protein phosphatase 2C domain-containing protein [Aggregatilineaceae bacterium]
MNLLRRMFGLSEPSRNPDDGITISHEQNAAPPPEEAVIAGPEPGARLAANGDRPKIARADDDTDPLLDESLGGMSGTRPLPRLDKSVPKPGQHLIFGQLSDIGMVRGNNQDAILAVVASSASTDDLPDFGVFIVADGMGGHHDGEKAASITTRIVAQHVLGEILGAMLEQKMDDPDRPAITEVLREALQRANRAVSAQIPEGGTTASMAAIIGDLAYIAHVGDSRVYQITDGGIEQITRDHSLVQRLIELDQLTPEEAAEHPQRNVLYRAIGQNETLDVDAITRRLPPRSRLLLCSDGLWNLVPEETIREISARHSSPQEVCDRLVSLANERGGPDNISVIVVQIPG